jgi:cyclic-di-GMP phosphodiesterase, flagellum assembly factor TipF
MSNRLRDRATGRPDCRSLARPAISPAKVAELARRLNGVERTVSSSMNRARGAVDPLAQEFGELGSLVRALADTVPGHDAVLRQTGAPQPIAPRTMPPVTDAPELALSETQAVTAPQSFVPLHRGIGPETVLQAIDAQRIDMYLQPIVTLPQRKVRYYEAKSRLRTEEGDVVPAAEFIDEAEAAGLMPRIDNLRAKRHSPRGSGRSACGLRHRSDRRAYREREHGA